MFPLIDTSSQYVALKEEPEDTPLQIKLNRIADMIAKWGCSTATILFLVLLIKFLMRLPGSNQSPAQAGEHFMQILIVSISVVVVAVPEGLPLAVTLALAYATIRMLKDNNLVRVLKACETMGNATTICCDKTGTLTENQMTVVVGGLGVSDKFVNKGRQENGTVSVAGSQQISAETEIDWDDATPIRTFFEGLSEDVKTLLRQSIALNSTAFERTDERGDKHFIGSNTESALLSLARDYLGMDDVATERSNAKVVQKIPFDSERKWMGTVARVEINGRPLYRLFVKGAIEIILPHSNQVIDLSNQEEWGSRILSDEDRRIINQLSDEYASRTLRVIALAYRDFYEWPPKGAKLVQDDPTQAQFEEIFKDTVFLGIFGIMDPLRPGVIQAVKDCRRAGVFVRMVTGDNVLTAKAIASQCGILTPGGVIMEGSRFRKLTQEQMDVVIPRLQVLARSSPEDKRTLVERLKSLGETVAVTGDGTNDGPALKTADVGFSMGISGTEVAKEASSIILMDDNFSSIVKAISWGRCVNDAVKKFLQVWLLVRPRAHCLVSAYCQFHCCRPHLFDLRRQQRRNIYHNSGAAAMGQSDSGYYGSLGVSHRSA